jgi:putative ABC transport system permease protein
MQMLIKDLRYGLRMSFKQPGFTLVAVITLALGIGANTAIFSVVNSVLLRPLPYPNSERLMTIWENHQALGGPEREWTSPTGFEDWRDQTRSFDGVAAYVGWGPTLTDRFEPEQLTGAAVSHNMFSLLGVIPYKGRSFQPEEDRKGAPQVAIISHGLWQRRFGSDPNIIGRTVTLSGENYAIIGVMPPGFKFPVINAAEVWRAIQPAFSEGCKRGCLTIRVLARLKPEATIESARTELNALARRIEDEFPQTNAKVGATLTPLREFLVGDVKPLLLVLLAAVALVLLIACVNVANLLLARAASRGKEIAIRAAMGAGRLRIIRQLLVESLLLAVIGGAVGLLFAYWLVDLLVAFSPEGTPRVDEIAIDRRILGFTFGVSILTGLVFGFAPAWQISKVDLNQTLKESGKSSQASRGGRRALSALVVAQTALALMLLIGAGLLLRSFLRLQRVDPGFNPNNLLTMRIVLPRSAYPDRRQLSGFTAQLIKGLKALPEAQSAGAVSSLPFGENNTDTSFVIEGRPQPPPNREPVAWHSSVTSDYFRAVGMRLRGGRVFTERDIADSPRVVIINETMARRYFPDENPLGKRIGNGEPDGWREIVGIVADVKHFGLNQDARPAMYLPIDQAPVRGLFFVVRSNRDPLGFVSAVRSAVTSIDKNLAVASVKTMESRLADSIAPQRFTLLLTLIFSALALLLAAAGVYGVMSYTVAQRTQEIGVRMALGARTNDVLRMIIRHGMILTLSGVAIGLAGAFALTRLMSTLLFGVGAADPVTFAAVSILLIAIALIACLLPARKASRVDPMIALRYE